MSEPAAARPGHDDAAAAAADFEATLQGITERFASAPREAVSRAREALAAWDGQADARQRARLNWALGLALSYAGQYAAGLSALEAALAAAPSHDTPLRCRVLRGLSIANEQLGSLDAALEWALKALALAREAGDRRLLADALLSTGVARSRCGEPEAGLRDYREAGALFEAEGGDSEALLSVLNNLGINCKNLGRHEEAVDHLQRALAIARALGKPHMAGVVASNLGEPLWRLGRIDEAVQTLSEAVQVLAESGYSSSETHARVMFGELLLARGDPAAREAARVELETALSIASRTGSANHVARANLALCGLHKAAGRPELALAHHEAYHDAERRQFNEDSTRRINALRVQHGLHEARLEAETQRLRHTELRQAHEELQALHQALLQADREKTTLLRQLEELSHVDGLTGLANRRRLDTQLREAFDRSRRQGGPLALALCDLDHFKRINDRFGHAVGDDVLRAVAGLLRSCCRSIDLVARYGGEEFCIVFFDADGAAAERACEAVRQAVQQHDWATLHAGLVVTLSLGIAEATGLPDAMALVAAADAELYRAKRGGRNRVCRAAAAQPGA